MQPSSQWTTPHQGPHKVNHTPFQLDEGGFNLQKYTHVTTSGQLFLMHVTTSLAPYHKSIDLYTYELSYISTFSMLYFHTLACCLHSLHVMHCCVVPELNRHHPAHHSNILSE